MAITLFGTTNTPADNGSNATTTITFTPPSSMLLGDFVFVLLTQRGTATFSNTTSGGQTWSSLTRQADSNNNAGQVFYCTFNGTWSTNPIFTFSAGTNTNGIMIVWRSDTGTGATWTINRYNGAGYTNSAGPTYNGSALATPTQQGAVGIQWLILNQAATTTSISGTGYVQTGISAQYRNLAGSDQTNALSYRIVSNGSNPGQGNFTMSGQSGTVDGFTDGIMIEEIPAPALASSPGSFSLTGNAAAFLKLRTLTAAAGAYALAGQAAGLSYAGSGVYTLTAAAGGFTLTGQAVNALALRALAAARGVFTLGAAQTILRADRTILADPGEFLLDGLAAGLAVAYTTAGLKVRGSWASYQTGAILADIPAGLDSHTLLLYALVTDNAGSWPDKVVWEGGDQPLTELATLLDQVRIYYLIDPAPAAGYRIMPSQKDAKQTAVASLIDGFNPDWTDLYTYSGDKGSASDAKIVVNTGAEDRHSMIWGAFASDLNANPLTGISAPAYPLSGEAQSLGWRLLAGGRRSELATASGEINAGFSDYAWIAFGVYLRSYLQDYLSLAEFGAFDELGQDAGLRADRLILADFGGLSAEGRAAALLRARRILAAAGAYSLTGNAARIAKVRLKEIREPLQIELSTGETFILISDRGGRLFLAAPPAVRIREDNLEVIIEGNPEVDLS